MLQEFVGDENRIDQGLVPGFPAGAAIPDQPGVIGFFLGLGLSQVTYLELGQDEDPYMVLFPQEISINDLGVFGYGVGRFFSALGDNTADGRLSAGRAVA